MSSTLSGITGYVPRWNATGTGLTATGMIYDTGTGVGIGKTNPLAILDVAADILVNGLTVGRGGGNHLYNTAVGI